MTLSGRHSEGFAMIGSAVIVSNETTIPCDTQALAKLAGTLFGELRIHPDVELGIRLVDVDEMTALHVRWMNEPGPTDVLSFPMDELRSSAEGVEPEPGLLGDIVLCPQVASAQAAESARTLDAELQYLTIHGVLHLIGYDHMTDEDYAVMFGLHEQLLAVWHLMDSESR